MFLICTSACMCGPLHQCLHVRAWTRAPYPEVLVCAVCTADPFVCVRGLPSQLHGCLLSMHLSMIGQHTSLQQQLEVYRHSTRISVHHPAITECAVWVEGICLTTLLSLWDNVGIMYDWLSTSRYTRCLSSSSSLCQQPITYLQPAHDPCEDVVCLSLF